MESAGVVINEEMSYVDAGYADPISDRFYEERKAIEKALHGELAPSEEAKPFIKPLLECYHKRFPLDLLYEYYRKALEGKVGRTSLKNCRPSSYRSILPNICSRAI